MLVFMRTLKVHKALSVSYYNSPWDIEYCLNQVPARLNIQTCSSECCNSVKGIDTSTMRRMCFFHHWVVIMHSLSVLLLPRTYLPVLWNVFSLPKKSSVSSTPGLVCKTMSKYILPNCYQVHPIICQDSFIMKAPILIKEWLLLKKVFRWSSNSTCSI